MAYIKNFETPEHKHNRMSNAPKSNYSALDNSTVKPKTTSQQNFFNAHIKQYTEFISWCRWYPDLFLDLIKPKTGGINLHFDQRVFLRCICRFVSIYGVFPRGWGKCVCGDTYLFTDKGTIQIKDLFDCKENGIEDYTPKIDLSVVNKDSEYEKIDRGVYNGYKNTKKIKTNYGFELECSNNHPIMIEKQNGEIDYVLAQDLKFNDKVLISTKNDIWGNEIKLNIDKNKIRGRKELNIPEYLDEDLALIIGYIIGDGCMSRKDKVIFSNIDEDILNNYKSYANKLNIDLKKENKYDYVLYGLGIRDFFYQLGFDYIKSDKKEIPECIMKAPKNIVIKTLQGIFDTDGSVESTGEKVSITSKSKKLIQQIQLLLLNLGIISSVKVKINKRYNHTFYVLRIYSQNIDKFKKIIGFSCKRKQDVLDEISGKVRIIDKNKYKENYFLDEIVDIQDSKNHVYDISVPNTHSFVSNGFISHNTWGEVISMFIIAVLYPGITMSLTAQTKANAAELLKDKYDEITRQYPLLKNEMLKPRIAKDDFELSFVNGSRIDVLANAQSSKGQRRNRIQIEESALIDNFTFEDALKPIVEIGRTTSGKLGVVDPLELNQQINFFTTSGFRGSDEWARSVQMYKDMVDLKGEIVLGSGWMLGCWMGRGSNKSQILKKKRDTGSVAFARNYEEKWVGAVDNQLVDIKKLLKTRTLTEPILDNIDNKREIILGVDVARSANNANNKTVISVVEEHHTSNGLIRQLDLINMFLVSNQLNFTAQACLVKKVQKQYNAKIVVVDTNGLGSGLRDELLKPNVDVETGDTYNAWDAVNGDIRSEYREAEPLLFALNSQNKDETKKDGRINSYAIINFIDCVDGQKLRLLEERRDNGINLADIDEVKAFIPFEQTNALVEEISNLKLKHLTNGEVTVEKVLNKIDKDRFSSLMYALWWAMTYDNVLKTDNKDLVMTIAKMNSLGSRRVSSLNKLFR